MAVAEENSEKVGMQGILDRLQESGEEKDKVSVEDNLPSIGDRSYGPFLMLPGLIAGSPAGGVPGLPTTLAAATILFSVQMLLGRQHSWNPDPPGRRPVKGKRLVDAAPSLHPLA